MKRTRAAALAVCLCALAGCAEDEAAPPPTIGDDTSESAAESPSESPTGSESASPEETFDDEGHVAMPGDIKVSDEEQQAVVDAWLAYWQVRMDAFAGPEIDPTALGEVAQGDAASQVVGYVDYLEQNKLTTEGDLRFDVTEVRVRGSSARLVTCVTNQSVDRRANGRAAEPLTPFYEFQGHLTRVSDAWAVTRVIDIGSGPC
ncbi:MAG TPA: hypothetical protein VFH10_18230 [Nocardioides sp.]|uniref:hypothetical protein n=1 Tax=Nocardioides sp. TaxID=35761 RepID=UPI002D8108BB|nr:hypothetical protein [Nocardioides sp.]HET6654581.1 hypothetical protein [Nocardioides sp.]